MHNLSRLVAFFYSLQLRVSEVDANLDAVSQEGRAAMVIPSNTNINVRGLHSQFEGAIQQPREIVVRLNGRIRE